MCDRAFVCHLDDAADCTAVSPLTGAGAVCAGRGCNSFMMIIIGPTLTRIPENERDAFSLSFRRSAGHPAPASSAAAADACPLASANQQLINICNKYGIVTG